MSDVEFGLRSGESWRDPFPMYRDLRDHDPVHHVPAGDSHGGFWFLSRFADVFDAARDTGTFSSARGLTVEPGTGVDMGEATPIVFLDPPDHTAFRRLVGPEFTPRQVSDIEDDVRDFVVERLERLVSEGGGDIVADLFKPLPSFVVAHYLGVPAEDRPLFDRWTEQIVAAAAQGRTDDPESGIVDLLGYFGRLIERRRTDPGDDMVSQLVALGEDAVSILWILGFAFTMVTGGNDTTTGLLGGSAVLLCDHPEQRRRLIDDPSMIPGAVEELLRLTSPVQNLARTTTRDVEVHGRTIPDGSRVLLGYAAANRDDREFGDDSECLDVGRNPERILSFSYGAHHCLGAAAARLQGRVALEELLARCPDYVVDGAAMEYATGNYVRRPLNLAFRPA
ncbi:MAG: cytochrome P450 [Actinomycetota bacterium]|nr:cytochrome P450 [Acidimicrobiales bacterium]MEC8971301.1 cytochrome P450 [Actinomycetota bacterium]MEC9448798.1 cytochrome P450 [Actinomycetota bacterium]MED5437959.1 cytochrome P450 [Actinomycetota bacterium]